MSICVLHRALAGQLAADEDARSGVSCFLADFLGDDRGRVENDAVLDRDAGDVAEGLDHGFQIARAEAEQVGVARGPVRHVVPEREQQRALEQKSIRMLGLAQAIEDALQRETDQHLIEIHALRLGDVEQAGAHGSRDVIHSTDSR